MEIASDSLEDTENLARALARYLLPGDVVFLKGTLGMGKSTFARALIRHAAARPEMEVPSPTFTLVQIYEDCTPAPIWHFDLYRLKDPEEIWELGWEEALGQDILLVEWPERLGDGLAPRNRLEIGFAPKSGNQPETPHRRMITLHPVGEWSDRLSGFSPNTAHTRKA